MESCLVHQFSVARTSVKRFAGYKPIMMPIVDAHVGLSHDHYSLNDYLDASNEFHVLRVVCVQQPQSKDTAHSELCYLQARATTRGSGGFPHCILASVDITDSELVKKLLGLEGLERVRGISHQLNTGVGLHEFDDYIESIDMLSATNLCLDLQATSEHIDVICKMAVRQPMLNIIVTVFSSFSERSKQSEENWVTRIAPLAEYKNVSIKLCGIANAISASSDAFAAALVGAIDLFGYERIMFSSGISKRAENASFDPLWLMYDKACTLLTARQRNHLFRLNAIRVFDL